MGGLLYKDFVSVKGKKLVWTMLILTVLYSGLRFAFPGTVDNAYFMVKNESNQTINILDTFFVMGLGIFLIAVLGLMNGWTAKLVEGERKNRIKGYLCSLPIEKNTYIASKYIFIAIAAYILMSLAFIWDVVGNAFCAEGPCSDMLALINSFIPTVIALALFSAAIELPMFLLMGKGKAMLVKTTIIMVIAFVCIGFLLFGNLNWLNENLNIAVFMEWCEAHTLLVSLIQTVAPVAILIFYYLSYRLTCRFENKGVAWSE